MPLAINVVCFFFIKLNVLKASSTKSVDPDPSELDPYYFPLYLHRLINESSTQPARITHVLLHFLQALKGLSRLLPLIAI